MEKEGLYPEEVNPSNITHFRLTSVEGKISEMPLDLGGFGVSRYYWDEFLYQKAKSVGADFILQKQVDEVEYLPNEDVFEVTLQHGEVFYGKLVLGAFGKRSKIDKQFDRDFMKTKSPYIGVKYHIHLQYEKDIVALHNFEGGYCGISSIEKDRFNLCYLGSREHLRAYGSISEMEKNVLFKNPHLEEIFKNASFLFEKPEVINEINFSPKKPVENHVLMLGDAAGLITPLCGNGMAIAIHTAKLATEAILQNNGRSAIEHDYAENWNKIFKKRLWMGRKVQWLFGSSSISSFSVSLMRYSPFIAKKIMESTHGNSIS